MLMQKSYYLTHTIQFLFWAVHKYHKHTRWSHAYWHHYFYHLPIRAYIFIRIYTEALNIPSKDMIHPHDLTAWTFFEGSSSIFIMRQRTFRSRSIATAYTESIKKKLNWENNHQMSSYETELLQQVKQMEYTKLQGHSTESFNKPNPGNKRGTPPKLGPICNLLLMKSGRCPWWEKQFTHIKCHTNTSIKPNIMQCIRFLN